MIKNVEYMIIENSLSEEKKEIPQDIYNAYDGGDINDDDREYIYQLLEDKNSPSKI